MLLLLLRVVLHGLQHAAVLWPCIPLVGSDTLLPAGQRHSLCLSSVQQPCGSAIQQQWGVLLNPKTPETASTCDHHTPLLPML